MSTQTRDDVRLNLLHILPAGATVTTTEFNRRKDQNGNTLTSIVCLSPNGGNISEAVAIVTGARSLPGSITHVAAVRGQFGAQQLISELSRALHGSSTALRNNTLGTLTERREYNARQVSAAARRSR